MATIHARQTARIGLRYKHCSTSSGHITRITHSLFQETFYVSCNPFAPECHPRPSRSGTGIIHTVKLVGTSSKKGRIYPPAVLKEGMSLYEGVPCFIDHAEPNARRKLVEKFRHHQRRPTRPRWVSVWRFALQSAHPMAPQILEAAEYSPDSLGMSHNASGPTRRVGDHEVVSRISGVSSVDLVHSPATSRFVVRELGRVDGHWDTVAARGGSVVPAPAEPSRLRGIHPKHPRIIEILMRSHCVRGFFGRVPGPRFFSRKEIQS